MRRTGFKNKFKPRKSLKRTAFKRKTPISGAKTALRRSEIRKVGAPVSAIKTEIQAVLRQIALLKFKGECIGKRWGHTCSGFRQTRDGELILDEQGRPQLIYQADHLISRGNSGTCADSRLVVLVCKGLHGWKSVGSNLRKAEYDEKVKKVLPQEIVDHWDRCEREKYRVSKMDWNLELVALKNELKSL